MAKSTPKVQNLYSQLSLIVEPFRDLHKYRRFNNSLIHYKDDYFLMTYRLFRPSRTEATLSSHEATFHPWNSNWFSYVDVTVLALLKWDGRALHRVTEMLLQYPKRLHKFDQKFDDSRIAQLQGQYFIYGQTWVTPMNDLAPDILQQGPKDSKQSNITKCLSTIDDCDAAVVVLASIDLTLSKKNHLPDEATVTSISMPCVFRREINKIHHEDTSIEKNWSFFESGEKIYFQYMIHPHMVISLDCEKIYTSPSPFEAIRKYYKCGLFFSPGGPLAPWKPGQLLGVGHLKYEYRCLTLLPHLQGLRMHPHSIYAFYFYTIANKPPFKILKFSHGFVPKYQGQYYSLVFPMGSVKMDDTTWGISMGNGDATPNIVYLQTADIESKLLDDIPPEDYTVQWLDCEAVMTNS